MEQLLERFDYHLSCRPLRALRLTSSEYLAMPCAYRGFGLQPYSPEA